MAYRALIIAIENYPNMTGGIVKSLPGTLAAGQAFRDWLLGKWREENASRKANHETEFDTQMIFCSEPAVDGGLPATLQSIRKCLREMRDIGRNETEELYVFFSGHGFTFSAQLQGKTDYILTSECERPDLTPECCLSFNGLVAWLRDHMGPGRHFFFVDACRNVLDATKVVPGPLPLTLDTEASGEPSTYVLQSTVQGAVAAVSDEFPKALLDGLRGTGEAKEYLAGLTDAMVVHFGSLSKYIGKTLRKQKATTNATGEVLPTDAVITTIRPIPLKTCTVLVEGATPGDAGTLLLKRDRGGVEKRTLSLPATTLELEPDNYAIGVTIEGVTIFPDVLVPIPVFEDTSLTFSKTRAGVTRGAWPRLRLATRAGGPDVKIVPGPPTPAWSVSLPHRSIAALLPHSAAGVDFSEQLQGEVTDMDLDVWLAILGGGRILSTHPGQYEKIGLLPLCDFSNEPAGASPIYVMAGLATDVRLEVAVADAAVSSLKWQVVEKVKAMAGIRHLRIESTPGPKLFSFRLPKQPAWTVASLATANRATLVTISVDTDNAVRVSQFLLPLGHLIKQLPPEISGRVRSRFRPLNDMRALATAGRAFRQRSDIAREMSSEQLNELLHAKWIDPIGSSLVAYQALRRSRKKDVGIAAGNLMRFFPTLPDGAALARLAGRPDAPARPAGVPLFIDGLRAYPDYADWLPLPAGLLDFSGPWTSWRGAVAASTAATR